jgi:hypothetical protein
VKVVFCIDDNPGFLLLLLAAVRSLRRIEGEDAPCCCVYAGDREEVLRTLEREGVPVARYAPRLDPAAMPAASAKCAGCFLKLELALVPELEDEELVLYCDADVLFIRPLQELFALRPPYMGMAREYTAPFYHEHESLSYDFSGKRHTISMPFPIWTFSSGVALFNLARLRRRGIIDHFLAFCRENVSRIGNHDQSLINYFFGRRITRLEERWNRPPYHADCLETAHIVHFHGPKPWDVASAWASDLRINHFETLRKTWMTYLTSQEMTAMMPGTGRRP